MAKISSTSPRRPNQERRNERERKRVNLVNDGFDLLRNRVPKSVVNKKLSKADTLREATKYIEHLVSLLGQGQFDAVSCNNQSPASYPNMQQCEQPVDYSMYYYDSNMKQETGSYSYSCSPQQLPSAYYYGAQQPYSQ